MRRKTIDQINDPKFVPDSKIVENSKILQMAYLDKIIEECDEDLEQNVKEFNSSISKR